MFNYNGVQIEHVLHSPINQNSGRENLLSLMILGIAQDWGTIDIQLVLRFTIIVYA